MAQSPIEDYARLAEALGLGGVIIELVRRLLARRKAHRILKAAAVAGAPGDPAGQAALQRALNDATQTVLRAHDRDFSSLRERLAKGEAAHAACEEARSACEAANRGLEERVALLELGRALPPYRPGR